MRPAPAFVALIALAAAPVPADTAPGTLRALATGGLKPVEPVAPAALAPEAAVSGSRGEVVALTLAYDWAPPKTGTRCVTLKAEGLPGAVRFSEILPFETKDPSFKGAAVGRYWDPLVARKEICRPGSGRSWVLVEISIPPGARAGLATGAIVASDAARLPVHLKVWRMEMPDRPAVELYSELTTWFALVGHHGKWAPGESELARLYERSMVEHRVVPIKHWVKVPELSGGSIDLRASGTLDDVVRPLPEWAAVSVPFPWPLEGGAKAEAYFSALARALREEKLLERAFVYLWDEPRREELGRLRKLAESVRRAAPGLKILVTTPWREDLLKLVDWFVPVADQFDRAGFPSVSAYEELRRSGKDYFVYVSCMSHGCGNAAGSGSPDFVIDRPGVYVRVFAWLARRYGLSKLLYYSVVEGYRKHGDGRDPWKDLWDFSGNGDGTLFYPGRPGMHGFSRHEPVESLRLKIWRQGSFDAEYLKWMDELAPQPGWWKGAVARLVRGPRDWEKDERRYAELRGRIGDALDAEAAHVEP